MGPTPGPVQLVVEQRPRARWPRVVAFSMPLVLRIPTVQAPRALKDSLPACTTRDTAKRMGIRMRVKRERPERRAVRRKEQEQRLELVGARVGSVVRARFARAADAVFEMAYDGGQPRLAEPVVPAEVLELGEARKRGGILPGGARPVRVSELALQRALAEDQRQTDEIREDLSDALDKPVSHVVDAFENKELEKRAPQSVDERKDLVLGELVVEAQTDVR